MTESVASSFSNASIDSISRHAQARAVESDEHLIRLVLRGDSTMPPMRLLQRQHHATKGVRDSRQFGWRYIRRQEPKDLFDGVIRAVESEKNGKGGFLAERSLGQKGKSRKGRSGGKGADGIGPLERKQLRRDLEAQPVYHLVIRCDPAFESPDEKAVQDIVTTYFRNKIEQCREMLFRALFDTIYETDTGESPLQSFRQLLQDAGYVRHLKEYFESGDTVRESSLHLMSRFKGAKCFLFQVLKHDLVDLLDHLLRFHTEQVTVEEPWLRLAEPLLPFGPFKMTAFHEAAYLGRPECLRKLCEYASLWRLDHQVRKARNRERRRNEEVQMTALECAEMSGNMECYNVLAPLFGVEQVLDARDANPREARLSESTKSRIEFTFRNSHGNRLKLEDEAGPLCIVYLAGDSAQKSEASDKHQCVVGTHLKWGSQRLKLEWPEILSTIASYMSNLRSDTILSRSLASVSQEQYGLDLGRCSVFAEVRSVFFAPEAWGADREEFVAAWWTEQILRQDSASTFLLRGIQLRSCIAHDAAQDIHAWMRIVLNTANRFHDHPTRIAPELNLALSQATPSELVDTVCSTSSSNEGAAAKEGDVLALVDLAVELLEERGAFLDYGLFGAFLTILKGRKLQDAYKPLAHMQALKHASVPGRYSRDLAQRLAARVSQDEACTFSDMERFSGSMVLMQGINEISTRFFDEARMVDDEPDDIRMLMDTSVIDYIGSLTSMWFSRWSSVTCCKTDETPVTTWRHFAMKLLADQPLGAATVDFIDKDSCAQELVAAMVCAAYDKALCTAVRMHVVLQHAYARWAQGAPGAQRSFFVDYLEDHIPEYARPGLVATMASIRKYRRSFYGQQD